MNDTRVGKELTEDIHEKVTELHASCASKEDIENQGREIYITKKVSLSVCLSPLVTLEPHDL